MEIFEMSRAHTAQIAEMENKYFSDPWSEKSIADELKNELSLWLVAAEGSTVVGYIGSQAVLGEADIMNVAVSAEYRRQGIGQMLVLGLIDALKKREVHCLSLEVRMSNEPAKRMYQKLGFVHVGTRPKYYEKPREDALILRKEWDQ